ncbi:MAG: hypothetical protein FJX02_12135 [Alphaproteobacteria bacterium]|nr:hypothetical protein [Alphaproteobacteria bacterium]
MTRHRPSDELLLDYAAGALPAGPALAVGVHVALEPASRRLVDRLGALAGVLLESDTGSDLPADALDRALSRLDREPVETRSGAQGEVDGPTWAPAPLRRHITQGVRWRRAFGGFERAELDLGGAGHRAALLKLAPGRGLPMHTHRGEEMTVVLQGGFTDASGSYGVGDFCVAGDGEHRPIADPGEPCIALIVLERPIVLTGPVGRLLNPLVGRDLI